MLPKLQQVFFALSNPNRVKIYELCLKSKWNITQISKEIGQSYKSTLNNLRILEDSNMIKKERVVTNKAQEVLIKSLPFKEGTVYEKVYSEIKKEEEHKL